MKVYIVADEYLEQVKVFDSLEKANRFITCLIVEDSRNSEMYQEVGYEGFSTDQEVPEAVMEALGWYFSIGEVE